MSRHWITCTGAEREDRLQALASEESVKPFDLSRLPLIRVSLFKLSEAEHVLIINLHHIVADGLSIGLLSNELDIFYRSFTGGGSPCPPELGVQYGDFALWQRQAIATEGAYAKQIEFWRTQLSGRLPVLELPADKPRPVLQSFKGSNVFFHIPATLVQRVKSLGEREGCTFFMTVLAAFQLLLHRYSGAEDIVIGTPIARRSPEEVEPLIGLILNMAALRCDVSGDPTFREVLRRTRATTLDAYSNSEVPFEVMLKELTFERDPSRNPVFQVMLQVLTDIAPTLGDLEISSFHFDLKFAQLDLTLHLYEEAGDYQGRVEYCSDLFEAETIRRLCGHFETLLEAIVRTPDQSISKLPMLTDAERHQLLVEWNATDREYAKEKCLHQLFEAEVERTPDAIAVIFGDQQVSYRELNRRANQLARYLQKSGVGPETLVGISMERSLEMVVGLLGILKAGGAYVALDPSYPKERLAFMLADTNALVLLTRQATLESLPEHGARVVSLDTDWNAIARHDEANPTSGITSDNLVYVIYTSGSTGKPKGVAIEHHSAVALLAWSRTLFSAEDMAGVLASTSICFDLSVFELFAPLSCGGKVILAENALALSSLPTASQVTLINTVPSAIAELLRMDRIPSSVVTINLAGEPLKNALVQQLYERTSVKRIFDLYGPSEDTTYSTFALRTVTGPQTIGRPIYNTQAYVLDRQMQPVPVGIPGELYLGGEGLARGYFNRPDFTDERFIPNPFSKEPGARLYKSGDRCRYLPDGNLEFLGRVDNQVKLRGFRIELGEIEAVLGQHPALRETLVLAREDDSTSSSSNETDKRLMAYLVTEQEPAPTVLELRNFLKEKLPDYMIPSAFLFLASLPLTPNGKIDRKALPLPDRTRAESEKIVAPRDDTETILCKLWAEVLKIDQVGIDDNFFALGGHSLLAAKLFTRLDETFGRSLPLGTLFITPTVRALAEHYRAHEERSFRSIVALRPNGSRPPVYAVPGVFGNVLGFADLSRELGPNQPFYALQSVGLDGKEAPLESIEEMAQLYIDEIRSVQPHGPYALLGACFGATVAYEIARQLLKDREAVALLGLLDPTLHKGSNKPASMPRAIKRVAAMGTLVSGRFHLYLDEMYERTGRDRIKYLAQKIRSLARLFTDDYASKGAQRELHQIEVYGANLRALDRYRRKSLSGPLGSLEIFETERARETSSFGRPIDWSDWWKGPTMKHRVAGKDSGDMLRGDNARLLAARLAERLRMTFSRNYFNKSTLS